MAQKDNDKVVDILTDEGKTTRVNAKGFTFKQELILTVLSQAGAVIGGALMVAASVNELRASKIQAQTNVDKIRKAV